jgi:hypothetical protein
MIGIRKLLWKDKWGYPRSEAVPCVRVFGRQYYIKHDQWWEQYLWIHYYNGGDYELARKSWGWIDGKTEESTWVNYSGLKNKLYKMLVL